MKQLIKIIFFAAFLLCGSAYKSFAVCANDIEMEAIQMRALQSVMMVAALSCQQNDAYNSFIKKYKSDYSKGARTIESYFKRSYGNSYSGKLNNFITQIANNASKDSLKINQIEYCNQTAEIFYVLLNSNKSKVAEYIKEVDIAKIHQVSACSTEKLTMAR